MRPLFALLNLSVLFFVLRVCQGQSFQRNDIVLNIPSQGPVRGTSDFATWTGSEFWQFFGIPYAESTSGSRRFKPPEKKRPWSDVLDATAEKRGCPTAWFTASEHGEDIEDCLHLSVYSKNLKGSAPVMVVLHGEMWFESERTTHPPDYLLAKDIVLVVPQFRTGVLGFLSTLTVEIPGNAGVFDAVLALEWVQENIRFFGGDPNRVTLVGQSAGAVVAHVISISPKISETLFHQLILQSGTALSPTVVRKNPIQVAKDIAVFAQCESFEIDVINRCFMNLNVKDLIDYVTTAVLIHEHEIPDNLGVKLTVNDPNRLLPENPIDLVRSERTRKYPMIAGVTKQDGVFAIDDEISEMMFIGPQKFNTKYIAYDFIPEFLHRLGVEDPTGTLRNLFRSKMIPQDRLLEGDLYYLVPNLIDISSIVTMKAPILQTVKLNNAEGQGRTFLYTFDYKGEFTRFGYGDNKTDSPYDGGVCHNDENIYLFPTPEFASKLNVDDTEIAKLMVDLWTSFAENGVPSAPGHPEWMPFHGRTGPYLKIDKLPNVQDDFIEEFYVTTRDEENNIISLLRPEYKHRLAPLTL